MSAREACLRCRFWDRYDEGSEHGLSFDKGDCRRRPPAISETLLRERLPGRGIPLAEVELELDIYVASAFPVTHELSWCGDFEAPAPEVPL
jgi:hypothetical protein